MPELDIDDAWENLFSALRRAMKKVPAKQFNAVQKAAAAFDGIALSEFQLDLLDSVTDSDEGP